ncbi:MAG: hypothetical protein HY815_32305 [Candidatus Riflebacteria bacterium]|nr:hypothetical protein [Candidatus Riflebacteria bacterium]
MRQNDAKDKPTFYYLDLANTKTMVPYPIPATSPIDSSTVSSTAYCVQLSKLSASGDGKPPFKFACPTTTMVSGRIYLSIGEGVKIGLVNTLDDHKKVTGSGLQSPPFGPSQQTPFDKVEHSCTDVLYANITSVDFFSLSLSMSVKTKQGTLGPVGFSDSRQAILADLLDTSKLPVAFRGTARNPGQGTGFITCAGTATDPDGQPKGGYSTRNVLRVLAPNHVIAEGAIDSTALKTYLDGAIANGWDYYSKVANQPASIRYPAANPQFSFKFLNPGDPLLAPGMTGTTARQLVFYCDYCSDPVDDVYGQDPTLSTSFVSKA